MITNAQIGALAGARSGSTTLLTQQSTAELVSGYGQEFDAMAWADIVATEELDIGLYLHGDLGITLAPATSNVTAWGDQSPENHDATKAGAGNLVYDDDGLNGHGIINFPGNAAFNLSWDLDVPTTDPLLWYFVFRQNVQTTNGHIIGGNSTNYRVKSKGASTTIHADNGNPSADEIPATLGTWFRGLVYFSGSTDDYIKIGSTGGNRGTNFGNSDTTGLAIGMRVGSVSFQQMDLAFIMAVRGDLSDSAIASLDATTVGAGSGWSSLVQI